MNCLVTDNVYCLVKIIQKDKRIIAVVQFEIKLFDFFSTGLNSSLIIFIRIYTVNYRNRIGQTPYSYEHYFVSTPTTLSVKRLAKRLRLVGLQEAADQVLSVSGHAVELWTMELEAAGRHVCHGLDVIVAHERRQTRQSVRNMSATNDQLRSVCRGRRRIVTTGT